MNGRVKVDACATVRVQVPRVVVLEVVGLPGVRRQDDEDAIVPTAAERSDERRVPDAAARRHDLRVVEAARPGAERSVSGSCGRRLRRADLRPLHGPSRPPPARKSDTRTGAPPGAAASRCLRARSCARRTRPGRRRSAARTRARGRVALELRRLAAASVRLRAPPKNGMSAEEQRERAEGASGGVHGPTVGRVANRSLTAALTAAIALSADSADTTWRVLEFRILGPLEAVDDGGPLALGGAKQRALLALLLRRRAGRLDRPSVDALWAGKPPPTAHLTAGLRLAAAKGARRRDVVTRPPGYRVRLEAASSISRACARSVDEARAATHRGARASCARRSRSGAGEPFAEFGVRAVRRAEIARLERAAAGARRGTDRGRARARPPRGARRRSRSARQRAPAARALRGAADARALSVGPAGRSARGLPRRSRRRSSRSSGSSRARCSSSSTPRSCARNSRRGRRRTMPEREHFEEVARSRSRAA